MKEIWKPIPGYEGFYEASTEGNLRSVDRSFVRSNGSPFSLKGRPITVWENPVDKHLMCVLSKAGDRRYFYAHTLIARTFLGERPEGMEVRHLDDNPNNNTVENLRYGTRSENSYDRVRNGIHFQANKTHCIRGHSLSGKNLKIEKRNRGEARRCISCNAANKKASKLKILGNEDFKLSYSNSHYLKIMGA